MYTWRYWFLKLGELLAMPDKIIRPPSINPVYLAILVPEAINPKRAISYAMQNRVSSYQLSCVTGDIDSNPRRAISYVRQNRMPTSN